MLANRSRNSSRDDRSLPPPERLAASSARCLSMPALIWAACFATALEPDDLEEEDLEEELLDEGFRGALDTDVLKPSSLKLRPRSSPNSLMLTFPVALSIETISNPFLF